MGIEHPSRQGGSGSEHTHDKQPVGHGRPFITVLIKLHDAGEQGGKEDSLISAHA